jgi:glyoxylate carboligase
MAKKIEVDIAYLKSVGLSQKQISDIIKNSEPEHWTNKLPFGVECWLE